MLNELTNWLYTVMQPVIELSFALESSPLLFAFLLGIVGSLVPCQLTSNLGAIAIYTNQSVQQGTKWTSVLSFIMGKVVVFSLLGLFAILIGKDFFQSLPTLFSIVRKSLGPLFILIGLLLLGVFKLRIFDKLGTLPYILPKNERYRSFLMGVYFSIAFCPTMFSLFFFTLIPSAINSSVGIMMPIIFVVGTSLPLIIIVYLLSTLQNRRMIMKNSRKLGIIVQRTSGVIFILWGVLDTTTYWL
ncbi:sulfite exporter TauE/SafE family protein [Priestia taiwanensis]|uniref:Cytochrome c biosynthesis protein n=1 Tax=Priestia taiwanensis TaxID=1347902 RepID=A0A917AJ29_9BACI|nr:sulfite exporter TauE/SafE family protein [Priestia taiwanensis]MBM7361783.1 cytochrome c biogenesis protein CcdA [Priestia taiwanensis]GGE56956.1 cytochrome c biosynthesis protein [Priestia taiwanensis]